jgi:arylsulfatase
VFGPRIPWVAGLPKSIATWSPDQDSWELYDLRSDFSQADDVAKRNVAKVAEMTKAFDGQAKSNSVYPVGGGLWSILRPQYAPHNPATVFNYTQAVVGVPEFAGPKVGGRSNVVTIDAEMGPEAEGVLYALGAFSGGVALWVDKGKLTYEYNLFEIERTRIDMKAALPAGRVKIEIDSQLVGAGHTPAMDVVIRVNGQEAARGRVPRTAPLAFTANDAFDVGQDSYSPVSLAYFDRAPFKFNGRIDTLQVRYLK